MDRLKIATKIKAAKNKLMHASDMKRENAAKGMLFEDEANVNRMFLMMSAIWKQRIGAIWRTFNRISLSWAPY